MLINALFAKINTCDPKQSEVFKTFIQHNYKEVMKTHWKDFSELEDCDQRNWLYFVHPKSAERQGKTLLNDEKIGLERMKHLFESLFYKVKVEKTNSMDAAACWKPQEYMFDQTLRLEKDNYKLIDHPADNYIDYNSMVDNLEEEHMRRDVFTTAIESTGQITAANAAEGDSSQPPETVANQASESAVPAIAKVAPVASQKPRVNKARDKVLSAQATALKKQGSSGGATAEAAQVVKRRGPRKKKDVIEQSEAPAAASSRLKR